MHMIQIDKRNEILSQYYQLYKKQKAMVISGYKEQESIGYTLIVFLRDMEIDMTTSADTIIANTYNIEDDGVYIDESVEPGVYESRHTIAMVAIIALRRRAQDYIEFYPDQPVYKLISQMLDTVLDMVRIGRGRDLLEDPAATLERIKNQIHEIEECQEMAKNILY